MNILCNALCDMLIVDLAVTRETKEKTLDGNFKENWNLIFQFATHNGIDNSKIIAIGLGGNNA